MKKEKEREIRKEEKEKKKEEKEHKKEEKKKEEKEHKKLKWKKKKLGAKADGAADAGNGHSIYVAKNDNILPQIFEGVKQRNPPLKFMRHKKKFER